MARWTRAARRTATAFPPPTLPALRSVSRTSVSSARKRSEHGRASLPDAYARVALAVGLSTEDVRKTWLAVKKHDLPNLFEGAHWKAVEMLRMSEAQLAQSVARDVKYANYLDRNVMPDGLPRYLAYHTFNSEHSTEGYPDWTLLDRQLPHLYFFELKRETYGPTPSQELWLKALDSIGMSACGCAVTVLGIVRPSNIAQIPQILGIE